MDGRLNGIRAVFMDVDDTLLDFNECARQNIQACFAKHGLIFSESIFQFFMSRNVKLWQLIEDRQLTVDELHRTRWQGIFDDLGIKADGVAFEQDFIAGLRDTAVPMEGAHEIMKYLHERYKVYVVSNASNLQQMTRLTKAGLIEYVDGIFGSLDIGVNKPDPRYYDYCFQHVDGVTPAETIIIGDSRNADISGGIAYGLHTCWFTHRGTPPDPAIVPEYTIHRLSEIRKIL
ncbi:MAG: YjjG family noncanonical pyrimidine nucleotidase [Bacteroidaceae bacterium]|nr:YjjG family noncanonical pyrimidine nucleotidase [Candidatus Colenecus caballi]MCQ2072198.1 YjjG family noncanonical pyrimidine nucleotidase [Bacteroidaceae bacterium]